MTQNVVITTAVDITPSGVRRKTEDPDWLIKRNQQRNYDTLIQVISLRTQPLNITVDVLELPILDEDSHKNWLMCFTVDRRDVLGKDGELFLSDIDGVPIVPALTETTPIFPPQFITQGSLKNISISLE